MNRIRPAPGPLRLPSGAAVATALVAGLPAIVLGIAFVAILGVDPAPGITRSQSPFTDEAWNVVNARNLVLLGTWSTDDWNLHLVNLPFSLVVAVAFKVLGVGILQARAVASAATVISVAALGIGMRRHVGGQAAVLGAAALAATPLVVYYGRLVYLEDLVMLFLVLGTLLVPASLGSRSGWAGIAAGALFAAAIGTKAIALVPVAGLLAGVLLVGGLSGPRAGRVRWWVAGALLSLGIAAAGWVLLVYLPNRAAVGVDLRILHTSYLPSSFRNLVYLVRSWVTTSDGVLPATLGLLVAGGLGVLASLVRRERLALEARLLLGAAVGWFVAGAAAVLVVSYRPSRYVVPLLPALGVMVAVGWSAITRANRASAAAGPEPPSTPASSAPNPRPEDETTRAPRWRLDLVTAAIAGALAILVLPGLAAYATWAKQPSTLPAIQDEVAGMAITTPIQGKLAPLFAMKVRTPTIIAPASTVNTADLYATQGLRWVIAGVDAANEVPGWVALHPAAWSARVAVACHAWGGTVECVYRLP